MPDLNSLGFTPDEEIPSDPIEDIPESSGGFEFLQPGYYTFQLPTAEKGFTEEAAVAEGFFKKTLFDGKEYVQLTLRSGQDNDGNRKGYPLRVKGHGLYGTQFNNAPRTFQGKKVNDLLLLLKALGHTDTPKTNLQYIQALLKYAGQSFRAEVSLSATAKAKDHGFDAKFASFVYFSNKRNKIPLDTPYKSKASGKTTYALEPNDKGQFTEELEVANPNTGEEKTLRVFGNLGSFASA